MAKSMQLALCVIILLLEGRVGYAQTLNEKEKSISTDKAVLEPVKAEQPFASLTILFGKKGVSHPRSKRLNNKSETPRQGILVYHLSAEGAFISVDSNFGWNPDTTSPKLVARHIEYLGRVRGDCVLTLWDYDVEVGGKQVDADLATVLNAIRSLGGVEKKFKRVQLHAVVSHEQEKEQ